MSEPRQVSVELPASDAKQCFVDLLNHLYADAGSPTLETLANKAQHLLAPGDPRRVRRQRISAWRSGTNLPETFERFEPVLRVLINSARKKHPTPTIERLYDQPVWEVLLRHARETDGLPVPLHDGDPRASEALADHDKICPYPGLAAYREEDAHYFFGRANMVAKLVELVRDTALGEGGLVSLVAPSGAGKTSLLRAGLSAELRGGRFPIEGSVDWPVVVLAPGQDPVGELIRHIPALAAVSAITQQPAPSGIVSPSSSASTPTGRADADQSGGAADRAGHDEQLGVEIREAIATYAEERGGGGARLVLIVDHFEELFTVCHDDDQRRSFIEVLHAASHALGYPAPALVILGLRMDFYQQCSPYPQLTDSLQHRQILLRPMNGGQLRQAITKPAAAIGLHIDDELIERLVHDTCAEPHRRARGRELTYEAGVLPLLSHALAASYHYRDGNRLTLAAYRKAGEIYGAVEKTGSRALEGLDEHTQHLAMRLLLNMIQVGEDMQPTRRTRVKYELLNQASDPAAAELVLERLVRARLVSAKDDSVQITHEALLRAWPLLRDRIERDQDGLVLRQRLEHDAGDWIKRDRDRSLLYRGSRLDAAREWRDARDGQEVPSRAVAEFLTASRRHAQRDRNRLRAFVAGLTTALVLALAGGGLALAQRTTAQRERDTAVRTQVIAEADRLWSTDASLASQLYLTAYRMRPTPNLYTKLVASENTALSTPLTELGSAARSVAFSPSGNTLAIGVADGTLRLWNTTDRTHVIPWGPPLPGHAGDVRSVAFSPDGRTLAAGCAGGRVVLWNLADPARPTPLGLPLLGSTTGHEVGRPPTQNRFRGVAAVAFSPNGQTLASGGADGTIRLWNVTDRAHPTTALRAPLQAARGITSVVFSPDGRTLASGSDDRTVRLWNVVDPKHPRPWGLALPGDNKSIYTVAFSPDGHLLASAGADTLVRLWKVSDPAHPTPWGPALSGNRNAVYSIAFSPDGHLLASAGADDTVRLWDVSSPAETAPVGAPLAGHTRGVSTIVFSPDGRTVVSGGADNTVRLWSLPPALVGHIGSVTSVTFGKDGRSLASGGQDGTVRLWDVADRTHPRPVGVPLLADPRGVIVVALSPDRRILASGGVDGNLRLWNVSDWAHPTALGAPLVSHAKSLYGLSFSADGHLLASAGADNIVRLWNIGPTGGTAAAVFSPDSRIASSAGPHGVGAVAFRPTGRVLACGAADDTVRLWDATDPAHPTPLGKTLPHTYFVSSVAFSPDGRTLASASADHTVRLWNTTDPAQPTPWGPPLVRHTNPVTSVAFSSDGRVLASGGDDGTVRLWNVSPPSRAHQIGQELPASTQPVRSVAFGPLGQILASAGRDQTVRLWGIGADQAIHRICQTTANTLTPAKWAEYVSDQKTYDPPCM